MGPNEACIGYMQAPLTYDEKSRLLARLNQRRSDASRGRLRNFPPAANMLKMVNETSYSKSQ